jgi:SNF2 family DNA or RNA helicase
MLKEKDLHHYQDTVVEHIMDTPFCGVFLDMGLGKTACSLTAVKKLMFEELDVSNPLVIAPKRVAENVWTSEIKKWEHLKHLKVSRIIGTEIQRRAALVKNADIHVIGRDNVAWLCGLFGGSMLPFDMLIIDESSSFKNPKSQRFKALRLVQPSFKRIVLLTGTPAPNGLIDLWSQIYLLDRGARLGKFIGHYRDKYFTPGQRNGHIVYNYKLQKDSEALIHEQISDICISMKAEDYLELPGKIDNYIYINFPPELQQQYDEFEEEQVLELIGDQEITAVNAAALSNKLLQFSNGAIYDDDKNWHVVHNLKIDAVEEIVEQSGGKPILVAWTYRHDMYRLKEKFSDARELKTEKDIEDWNAGLISMLLMHPASGGHGLNLQAGGNIIVWFGQTWSLELYQQLNARLDRQGQTDRVIIHHLVAVKTVERDVVKSLESKDTKQESLLKAVKARIKKYLK